MELNDSKNQSIINKLINNKKMEKLTFLIMINMFYILIGSYLSTTHNILHSDFAKGLIPLLFINAITGIVICKKGYCKKKTIYIFMLAAIAFGIISTIFAINKEVAIFGYNERNEGLISIIYYFSLMFLSSFLRKDFKKKIILFILIIGVIQCVYGIFEAYGEPNVSMILKYSGNIKIKTYTWSKAFCVNPNFFGTYMLICLTLSIGSFVDEKEKKKSIFYILLTALFMYGLLVSDATSCAVGLIVVFIYLLIYCIKNKFYKKLIIIITTLTCMTALATIQSKTTLLNDILKTGQETIEIAKGNIDDSYGTNRFYIWRETLKIVPQNLLHGVGIDNFPYAFDGEALRSSRKNFMYDKAHNEYLQILVTEGILCLITYLVMYGIILVSGIKYSFKNKEIVFILPVIGYLIQAFFNISIIEVAPLFFIILGLNIENK